MKKLIILSVVALFLFGCHQATSPNPWWPIIYRVTGTVPAKITYNRSDGKIVETTSSLPFEAKFNGIRGDFVSITATTGRDSGLVRCEIFKNAQLFNAAKDSGTFLSVNASGTL